MKRAKELRAAAWEKKKGRWGMLALVCFIQALIMAGVRSALVCRCRSCCHFAHFGAAHPRVYNGLPCRFQEAGSRAFQTLRRFFALRRFARPLPFDGYLHLPVVAAPRHPRHHQDVFLFDELFRFARSARSYGERSEKAFHVSHEGAQMEALLSRLFVHRVVSSFRAHARHPCVLGHALSHDGTRRVLSGAFRRRTRDATADRKNASGCFVK